jgi:succinate dehydrogenase/fumarate reductase flavoprotein subunit
MRPKVHYTMGGIQIDKFAWILSIDQQPLEGLLAAGEVTGGIHGACRAWAVAQLLNAWFLVESQAEQQDQ